MYAEVIILRNAANIDNLFTYTVPEAFRMDISIGARVIVPFGPSTFIEGIVYNVMDEMSEPSKYKLKPLQYVFDDGIFLTSDDLKWMDFIRTEYLCSYAEAVSLLLPSGTMTNQFKTYRIIDHSDIERASLSKSEIAVLSCLENGPLKEDSIISGYASSTQKNAIKRLVALGRIEFEVGYEVVVKDRYIEWLVTTDKLLEYMGKIPKHHNAKIKLAEHMLNTPKVKRLDIQDQLKISKSVVDGFVKADVLRIEQEEDLRIPVFMESHEDKSQISLTSEQMNVYSSILEDYENRVSDDFLLHGVTGSGKTEVYAELIEYFIGKGKKAILMVPEIALTPQIVARFVSRFGKERIALIHSKISQGEKHDQWKKIRKGEYDLIIGARSAIFTPVEDLGVIIIDESHENTYRSEKRPKYSTYEVAKFKAAQTGAIIVSGSATPSINEYYDALSGNRKLVKLNARYNSKEVPSFEIVDMRDELLNGNRSILSERLHTAIEERLEKKEQVIIFLNRKGHSTFVSCRSCGFTLACPNCDVTLTYFKGEKSVRCNYCGYESFIPKLCPKCQSTYFKYFGVGTEKVEEQIKSFFPNATVDRMDKTTTTRKGSVERIVKNVENSSTDILIGTQMVAKGFDFKRVTLIGILSADLILNFPSYQSSERAYQLFNQVAGRAGRGEISGEVILQTYVPDHYAINHTSYEAFYDAEIQFRNALNYPPFTQIINLLFSSKEEEVCKSYAEKSQSYLRNRLLKNGLQNSVDLYDANPALLKKIDGMYRWQVLIKCKPEHQELIKQYVKNLDTRFAQVDNCKLAIDLNATNIL
ncbi:MAG: primosomal protein N' [Bacillota bacterium]|nr:primosomal protein N' [Bacillota bacterium]